MVIDVFTIFLHIDKVSSFGTELASNLCSSKYIQIGQQWKLVHKAEKNTAAIEWELGIGDLKKGHISN